MDELSKEYAVLFVELQGKKDLVKSNKEKIEELKKTLNNEKTEIVNNYNYFL